MKKTCVTVILAVAVAGMVRAQSYPGTYYPQAGYGQQNPNQPPPSDVYSPAPPAKRIGAGIILGEPVGASVKFWLNETMALDGAVGWSTHRHSSLYVNADVLWHKFDLIDISPASGKMPLYFGVGALVRARDHGEESNIGVRVPVGVSYIFDDLPFDVFAELAPAVDVKPSLRGELTGGIGVRFWF